MLTDESILAEMQRLVKNTGKPASTLALAVRLEVSQECIQKRVRRLEEAGLVHRPLGKRKGYSPFERARVLITKDDFPIRGEITAIIRKLKRANAYYVVFDGETSGEWYVSRHLQITH